MGADVATLELMARMRAAGTARALATLMAVCHDERVMVITWDGTSGPITLWED